MTQNKLVSGNSDKTDCMKCSAYSPNGEGVFYCRFQYDSEVHKCTKCGYCDAFRPITDRDAEGWLGDDVEAGVLVKTTFNRWKWVDL